MDDIDARGVDREAVEAAARAGTERTRPCYPDPIPDDYWDPMTQAWCEREYRILRTDLLLIKDAHPSHDGESLRKSAIQALDRSVDREVAERNTRARRRAEGV